MENIIKGIRRYYPVSDSSLEMLFSHMKKLELPKKHLLIHGGVSDRHVYFIEKGFCRSYCLRDGEEITIWFSREGDITFAMKDLYHNQPGYEYVELLEDCELYAIRIDELNQIYETNIEIANWGRIIHQECLLYMDIHQPTIPTGQRTLRTTSTRTAGCNSPCPTGIYSFLSWDDSTTFKPPALRILSSF